MNRKQFCWYEMRQNHDQMCIRNHISECKHRDFGMDTNCSCGLSLKWSSEMELKIIIKKN